MYCFDQEKAKETRSTEVKELRLSRLFSDGMVMQRNKTNFVRGNTDPGIMVKGTFGAQKFQAESDEQGRFEIELPSLPAGGPEKPALTGKNNSH